MSLVFQNIDPPPPSPPGECVLPPQQRRRVHTRRAEREVGGQYFGRRETQDWPLTIIISLRVNPTSQTHLRWRYGSTVLYIVTNTYWACIYGHCNYYCICHYSFFYSVYLLQKCIQVQKDNRLNEHSIKIRCFFFIEDSLCSFYTIYRSGQFINKVQYLI